jgi:hypothetical protein
VPGLVCRGWCARAGELGLLLLLLLLLLDWGGAAAAAVVQVQWCSDTRPLQALAGRQGGWLGRPLQ